MKFIQKLLVEGPVKGGQTITTSDEIGRQEIAEVAGHSRDLIASAYIGR